MEILINSEDSCTFSDYNFTKHNTKLPTSKIELLEKIITPVKPSHYRINVINTLIHSVVLTYDPHTTEPIIVHHQDGQKFTLFNENHFALFQDPMTNKTVCNKKRFQKLSPRVVPS